MRRGGAGNLASVRDRLGDLRLQLVFLALGALGVRAAAIGSWSRRLPLEGDQAFYHSQADDLAAWLGFTYRHPVGEHVTTAVHPPLHSALLGLATLVGLDSPGWHRVVGSMLGAATVITVGLVADRVAGPRAAVIAAALAAVLPTLWINDALVLSESSYAFTVALVLLASIELLAHPTSARAAALGGAVALATLARAEAALLVAVLAAPLVAGLRDGVGARLPTGRRRVLAGWVVLGGLVVGGPWVARNLTAFERPVVVSSGAGFVLEIASCDATFSGDLLGYWSSTCDGPWAAGDETATEAAKRSRALGYLSSHRSQLPRVAVARVARMWDVWRPGQSVELNAFFERRGRASSWWAIRMWWVVLACSIGGALALRRRPSVVLPFAAIAVTTTAAAALSFGITRYRTGLEVAATVLAAVGIDAAWRLVRARRSGVGSGSARIDPAPSGATA